LYGIFVVPLCWKLIDASVRPRAGVRTKVMATKTTIADLGDIKL